MNFLLIQSAGEHPENALFRECLCLARGLQAIGHEAVAHGKGHMSRVLTAKLGINFELPLGWDLILDWADAIVTLEQYPDKCDWLPDLASVKKPKLLWAIDEHCRGWDVYAREAKRGQYDVVLHATLMAVELSARVIVGYEAAAPGCMHQWFPNAYDDTLIGPRDVEKNWDAAFVGNRGSDERRAWISRLARDFDFPWIQSLGESMVKYINGLDVHWNMNIADDINYRCFETIGCGVPLVTNSRGPVHDEQYKRLGFVNVVNCMIYYSYDECVEAIRWILSATDATRQAIGKNALRLAARHTYKERAKQLVEIVEGL